MILKKNKDNKLYLQVKEFKVDDDFEHLFSTRIGWDQNDLSGDLADILEVDKSKIYTVKQVHGIEVEIIKDQHAENTSTKERDGLITNLNDIVLTSYHADCVPLYFYDRVKKVIGIAHSGWKGSLNNISKEMIEAFKQEFSSDTDDIVVAIGPSIGSCCYEIQEDVARQFREKFTDSAEIILVEDDKMYLDLWKINKSNLLNSGISQENIMESDFCTSCNIDYLYSYRRENTKDRMIGAIKLSL